MEVEEIVEVDKIKGERKIGVEKFLNNRFLILGGDSNEHSQMIIINKSKSSSNPLLIKPY